MWWKTLFQAIISALKVVEQHANLLGSVTTVIIAFLTLRQGRFNERQLEEFKIGRRGPVTPILDARPGLQLKFDGHECQGFFLPVGRPYGIGIKPECSVNFMLINGGAGPARRVQFEWFNDDKINTPERVEVLEPGRAVHVQISLPGGQPDEYVGLNRIEMVYENVYGEQFRQAVAVFMHRENNDIGISRMAMTAPHLLDNRSNMFTIVGLGLVRCLRWLKNLKNLRSRGRISG